MSKLDGTKDALTYGQALAEIAARVSWPSEEAQREVVDTILKEHDLYVEPDYSQDPEDVARAREAVRLQEENAALRAEKLARDRDAELDRLRAENDALKGGGTGDGGADDGKATTRAKSK